jgi:hypothetical protein
LGFSKKGQSERLDRGVTRCLNTTPWQGLQGSVTLASPKAWIAKKTGKQPENRGFFLSTPQVAARLGRTA